MTVEKGATIPEDLRLGLPLDNENIEGVDDRIDDGSFTLPPQKAVQVAAFSEAELVAAQQGSFWTGSDDSDEGAEIRELAAVRIDPTTGHELNDVYLVFRKATLDDSGLQ